MIPSERLRRKARPSSVALLAIFGFALTGCANTHALVPIGREAATHPSVGTPEGSGVARPGPQRAAVWIEWIGGQGLPTGGGYSLKSGSPLSISLSIRNTTAQQWTVRFDYFIASPEDGAKRSASSPLTYPATGGVWDWQQTQSSSPTTKVVEPYSSATQVLTWPGTESQDQPVPPGTYEAYVPYWVNGQAGGEASAVIVVD